ncbi:restriction system modified-DNA reader domain-containing protein [Paraburkholderia sediminicola]|uniref:restriction system modified-DNA reader domain-containing protein n=1 Tax=Paraburkholderia sediminicola TaxID=458836 RepID=UPI0038BAE373
METVSLTISAEMFARLQSYAVPLVDTTDTILQRLCDHWDASPPAKAGFRRHVIDTPLVKPEPTSFKTSRGVPLPIPLALYADYAGKRIEVSLTADGFAYNGRYFSDPSSVAVAAKKDLGASDTQASTNGWTFWMLGDRTGVPQSLDTIRQAWLTEQSRRQKERVSKLA